jgi:hypothetical protein
MLFVRDPPLLALGNVSPDKGIALLIPLCHSSPGHLLTLFLSVEIVLLQAYTIATPAYCVNRSIS